MDTIATGTPDQAGFDKQRLALIRQRAASWVDGEHTRAMVLLAARNGVVAFHEAWGTRTPGDDAELITTNSLFHTGSISKLITATAVMMLAERGLLGINRPVSDYIPELKAGDNILIRHLLTHTSGYADEIITEAFQVHVDDKFKNLVLPPQEETDHNEMRLNLHAKNVETLAFEPGKRMDYCTYNYDLLAELVRRASGRCFKDYVEQEILGPLGMHNSRMGITEEELDLVVLRGEGQAFEVFEKPWGLGPWGGYGLRASAQDIAILAQTFLNGGTYNKFRLLSPATVAQMTTNQIPGVGTEFDGWHDEASWAFGWRVLDADRWKGFDGVLRSKGSYDHGGVGGNMVWVDPARNLVGVYLSAYLDCEEDSDVQMFGEIDLYQDMITAACY